MGTCITKNRSTKLRLRLEALMMKFDGLSRRLKELAKLIEDRAPMSMLSSL